MGTAVSITQERWVGVQEVVDHLHVTKAWIYERTAAGTIPVHRIGGLLRFRLSELDAWAESGDAAR